MIRNGTSGPGTTRGLHVHNIRRAHEAGLFDAARDGDRDARKELVDRYLPLARRLARHYRRSSVPLDDLEQVASLALVTAIDRFEPARGNRFSSYAVPTISGALKRHFRDTTWAVRVPGNLRELGFRIQQQQDAMLVATGRRPTAAELAATQGVEVEDVLDARLAQRAYHADLLSRPCGSEEDEEMSLGDTLGELDAELERVVDRAALDARLEQLDTRARLAVELYYRHELPQTAIAEHLGCSQMQVSRLLRAALAQLQEP
jgi:RNA polymerase sigma-B factor